MSSDQRLPHIVVLGIGNLLWADEGFGVRCVEALQQRYTFAEHVELIDGGTQGLYLVQHVQAADKLLILDAIDYGLPPGTLKEVRNDEVPRFLGAKKMSLHQTGFQEVLALAQLTGASPPTPWHWRITSNNAPAPKRPAAWEMSGFFRAAFSSPPPWMRHRRLHMRVRRRKSCVWASLCKS